MTAKFSLENHGDTGSIYLGDRLIADCYFFGHGDPRPWRAFRPGGDNPDTATPIAVADSIEGLLKEVARG